MQKLEETYKKHKEIAKKGKKPVPIRRFPYALGKEQHKQETGFPLPNGYLVYLVMEKLPGVQVQSKEFWNKKKWTKEMRKAFRDAFEEAARYDHQFIHINMHFDIYTTLADLDPGLSRDWGLRMMIKR